MSGLETALLVGGLVSAGLTAASTIAGGAQANKNAKAQARILQQQADQELAAARREAGRKRQEVDYLLSAQQAAAAASGGGASDPTVLDLMGGTAAEGETQAEELEYLGAARATDLQNQASYIRQRGKQAKKAALFDAAGTIAGQGLSLYGKYGRGFGNTYSGGKGGYG